MSVQPATAAAEMMKNTERMKSTERQAAGFAVVQRSLMDEGLQTRSMLG